MNSENKIPMMPAELVAGRLGPGCSNYPQTNESRQEGHVDTHDEGGIWTLEE